MGWDGAHAGSPSLPIPSQSTRPPPIPAHPQPTPLRLALLHPTSVASMCMYIFTLGFLTCRASHLHRTWPPAWTGFHESQCVFNTGPPALSGFPSTRSEVSSIGRLPRVG